MPPRKVSQDTAGQQAPGVDKSQELLEAVNALAWGVTSLAESLPQMVEQLEVVSQQFSVLIAAEAQHRNVSAQNMVRDVLMGLSQKVFNSKKR